MPRKRMISPEFWRDEEIGAWSIEARLFYIGLWSFADDEGRLRAHPKLLKSQIFPYDEKINIEKLKAEVSKKVLWYKVDGQEYGYIKNFLKHQRIDRPSKSQLPAPPKDIFEAFLENGTQNEGSQNIRRTLSEDSLNTHGGLTEDSLNTQGTLTPNTIIQNTRIQNTENYTIALNDSNESCSEPVKKPRQQKISFNFDLRAWENISNEDMAIWEKAYPAVDITQELSKMADWLISNPEKKKKNYRRFITNWLSRTQERGGSRGGKQVRASRVGEHKEKYNYPPGYWEKFRELMSAGLSGKELTSELKKIFPEYYKNLELEDDEDEYSNGNVEILKPIEQFIKGGPK